ncbi:hypothetical protein LguiA_004015 [Lonicera macranthoides]
MPIRVLSKAKNFYIKSMHKWAEGASNGNLMSGPTVGHFSALPKSFSVGSSRSDDREELRELVRTLSNRNTTGGNGVNRNRNGDVDLYMQQQTRQSTAVMGSRRVPRSCSVGMGRIDEDKACDFGEEYDSFDLKSEFVYPRSRSYAVNTRSAVF